MHKLHSACSRKHDAFRAFLTHMSRHNAEATSLTPQRCAVCNWPVEGDEAGADVRLYLGPGDKLAELWLPLCSRHIDRFRVAYDHETIECRVASIDRGIPTREVER
jgi:hypothetical protein